MLLLVLVMCSFYGSYADVPEVKIYVKKNDASPTCPSDQIVSPKLMMHKPFQLTVYSDVTIHDGKCYPSSDPLNIYINLQKSGNHYVPTEKLKLSNKRTKNNTCELNIKKCPHDIKNCTEIVKCHFMLDIRNPDLGYLTINGNKTETKAASETNDFDAYGYYSFFEGEPVTISCRKCVNSKTPVNLKLSYTKPNGETIMTKKKLIQTELESVKMYKKMTADNHGGYVDCHSSNYDETRFYITRIYFELNNTAPALGFQVNGLTLSPLPRSRCKQDFCFKYEYYDKENLTVQSMKDEQMYGDMYCTAKAENDLLPEELDFTAPLSSFRLSTVLVEELHKNVSLECFVKRNSERFGKPASVSLVLVPNNFADYRPLIKGVTMANVSVMYNSSVLNTLHYEYNDNETLFLRCYSYTSGPKWVYNGSEVERLRNFSVTFENVSNNFIISDIFRMKFDYEYSIIRCISPKGNSKFEQITEIEIRRNSKYKAPGNRHVSETKFNPWQAPGTEPPAVSDKLINKRILIGACLGTLVLVVVVISIIIRLAKRKPKKTNLDTTNVVYDNLQEHNERATPVSNRWIEVQYAAPEDSVANNDYAMPYRPETVEELYSKPLTKNQRNDISHEDPYASVGDSGPTYAEALPKSKRFGQGVKVLPSNESNYAKLSLKTGRPNIETTSDYEVSNRESPYASVTPSESPYAEFTCGEQSNDYTNVFDNQSYVNTHSKNDYAEPAYCEIGKFTK